MPEPDTVVVNFISSFGFALVAASPGRATAALGSSSRAAHARVAAARF
jgi:hypothetical protein